MRKEKESAKPKGKEPPKRERDRREFRGEKFG